MMRPGPLGLFVNPFYFARMGLYDAVRRLAPHVRGRTLDVGCGSKPYEGLFPSSEYVGLELETPENRRSKQADAFYDGRTFPFESRSFDSAVCNQVLEHVFEPEAFLAEIHRVLRTDGCLFLTVPFAWDEHEQPRDFGRYTSFGLEALLVRSGFRVEVHEKTMADIRAIFQLLNTYVYKVTVTGRPYVDLLSTLLLVAPLNLLATMLSWVTPRNQDLFLDNVVVARKVGPA
jgi:SAM-dependent methyltransferase